MQFDIPSLYALSGLAFITFLALAYLTYATPRAAVSAAFLLVLIAGTRFRLRDASLALSGEVDAPVFLELALYGLVAATVGLLWLFRRGHAAFRSPEFTLIWYILVCIASTLWSLAPSLTLVKSLQLVVLLALATASVRVVGTDYTARALMNASTFYVLCCTAVVLLIPELRVHRADGRFNWFSVHPIAAGSFAGLAAVLVLSAGLHSARRWRTRILGCPIWLFPAPLIAVLVLTGSRGPLLAFVAAAGVLLLKRLRPRVAAVVALGALLLVMMIVGLGESIRSDLASVEANDNIFLRLLFRSQTADQVMGMSGRTELWQSAIPRIYESPFVGHGYQGARSLTLETAHWAGGTHNGYLQTLLDLGLLGAAFLWTTIVLAMSKGLPALTGKRPLRWEENATFAVLVFSLVNAITHESFAMGGYEAVILFTCVSLSSRAGVVEPASQTEPVETAHGGRSLRVPRPFAGPARLPAGRSQA